MQGLEILATGHYVPPYVVSNDMLEKMVDTSNDWIIERTGIETRHYIKDENTSSMAAKAARQALEQSGVQASQIRYLIVSTVTPDYVTPSVACMLQKELGLSTDTMAIDINAACSGFTYGLRLLHSLLQGDSAQYGLMVSAEALSKITDFADRSTCVLFGDGAGAMLVKGSDTKPFYHILRTDGNEKDIFCPGTPMQGESAEMHLHMNGKKVFRFATTVVPQCIAYLLEQAHLQAEDIDYFVCHQANARIIRHIQNAMGLPGDKFYMNVQRYGNTSSASIPLAISEMSQKGLLKPGMKIICVGFGGGFTWGGVLMEW